MNDGAIRMLGDVIVELIDVKLKETFNHHRSNMALNLDITRSTFYQQGMTKGIEQGIEQGVTKGRQEGKQEGKQEGFFIVAMNMYEKRIPLEQIKELTGMPDELWQQFLDKIGK